MKPADPENPILTKNDQEVLRSIIQKAKLPDTEIARQMRLSQQAIYKIRTKLEEKGIIEGYMPIINYKKIGINVMTILAVKILPTVWEKLNEEQVNERLRQIPNVIGAFRVPEGQLTHLLIMAFKNSDSKDRVIMKLETIFSKEIEIIASYPFSVERLITMSSVGLLNEILDKKEKALDYLFLK